MYEILNQIDDEYKAYGAKKANKKTEEYVHKAEKRLIMGTFMVYSPESILNF